MPQSKLCVSVPLELQCYQKIGSFLLDEPNLPKKTSDFGIKVVRNDYGAIDYIAYYSDTGDIAKRVYYAGSCITLIRYYRNNRLYQEEDYFESKLVKKRKYDSSGNIKSNYSYKYNRAEKTVCILKWSDSNCYSVEYDYDELNRVNSRRIKINNTVTKEQHYKYDILDRLIDYQDNNQKIHVNKLSSENKLINYTITDNMDNEINVVNYFNYSQYSHSEISMNGHTVVVKDIGYVDNVMLKKPYTTEDDLDLIISDLFKGAENSATKRVNTDDISLNMINENISKRTLPISIRKRLLYTKAS